MLVGISLPTPSSVEDDSVLLGPAVDPDLALMCQALWTKDGAAVVYPCHAVIVVLHISTGEQRFFLGHTDKVSAVRAWGVGHV